MRKRSYSLDQIHVPRNEFDEAERRKRSYSLDQMPVTRNEFDDNFITLIKMYWKNFEITWTMKFVAILNFITILIVRYGKQIKLGRFSLI